MTMARACRSTPIQRCFNVRGTWPAVDGYPHMPHALPTQGKHARPQATLIVAGTPGEDPASIAARNALSEEISGVTSRPHRSAPSRATRPASPVGHGQGAGKAAGGGPPVLPRGPASRDVRSDSGSGAAPPSRTLTASSPSKPFRGTPSSTPLPASHSAANRTGSGGDPPVVHGTQGTSGGAEAVVGAAAVGTLTAPPEEGESSVGPASRERSTVPLRGGNETHVASTAASVKE